MFWEFITLNAKAKDAAAVRSEMIATAVTMYNIRWSLRKFPWQDSRTAGRHVIRGIFPGPILRPAGGKKGNVE